MIRLSPSPILSKQGLFEIREHHRTEPMPFLQSVHDYVEQFFSTASLARELMSPDEAAQFARKTTAIVREYADGDGRLPVATVASVIWGKPLDVGQG